MGLGTQVVDLIRFDVVDYIGDLSHVGKVSVVEEETGVFLVGINVYVVDSSCVECTGSTDYTVYLIIFREKELGKIRSILTGDAGDKCFQCNRLLDYFLLKFCYSILILKINLHFNFKAHIYYCERYQTAQQESSLRI